MEIAAIVAGVIDSVTGAWGASINKKTVQTQTDFAYAQLIADQRARENQDWTPWILGFIAFVALLLVVLIIRKK
ncbi:MAG: hypothetical protein AAFR61_15075 [Bacteroidota bacterium]